MKAIPSIFLFFLAVNGLFAINYTVATDFGPWSVSSTWSPAGVPGPGDKATIDNMSVTLDGNFTIQRLVMTGSSLVGTGILTIESATGSGEWLDGTIGGSVTVDIGGSNGLFEWQGGQLLGGAKLRVPADGELTINGAATKSIGGNAKLELLANSTTNWSAGDIALTDAGKLDIDGAFNAQAALSILATGYSGTGITIRSNGHFSNAFDMLLSIFSPVEILNGGKLEVIGETRLKSGLACSGEIAVGSGAHLYFENNVVRSFTTGATITGLGGNLHHLAGETAFNVVAGVECEPILILEGGTLTGSGQLKILEWLEWQRDTIDVSLLVISGAHLNIPDVVGGGVRFFTNKTYQLNGTTNWENGDISIGTAGVVNQTGLFGIGFSGLNCASPVNFFHDAAGSGPVFNNSGDFHGSQQCIATFQGEVQERWAYSITFSNVQFNNTGSISGGNGPGLDFTPILNTSSGFIAPDGTLEIIGNLAPSGNLSIDIYDGSNNDRLYVTGNMALSGTLTVTLTDPMIVGNYVIAECAGGPNCRTNTFASTVLPPDYFIVYGDMQVIISHISLPLELTGFFGKTLETANRLTWETASEINTDRFDIERSEDQFSWKKIGSVAAAGISVARHDYFFDDKNPAQKAWYRLRMVDTDGSESFSPVVFCGRAGEGEGLFEIYPNPIESGGFWLKVPGQFSESPLDFALFDVAGRLVFSKNMEDGAAGDLFFPMERPLARGSYFLEIKSAPGLQTLHVFAH